MADISSNPLKRLHDSESSAQRKVRKGTQSCWECKRRKVKCIYATCQTATCKPCTQRGTLCVSQELPDPGRTSQIDDRISRVEAVLEEVLRRLPDRDVSLDGGDGKDEEDHEGIIQTGASETPRNLTTVAAIPTPKRIDQVLEASGNSNSEHQQLSRALLAALPKQNDLDSITREPLELPSCLQGLPCYLRVRSNDRQTLFKELTRVPPADSHPTHLAKVLLILSSYLQGMPQGAAERLTLLGVDHKSVASNAVETVRRHILRNDEMTRSLDGIECLIIESMYHNNAGRLRDACLALRSALSIAQYLGLDRKAFRPWSQISLRHPVREETCEESLWIHLLSSDRYLSLMLGLPQGAPDSKSFGLPESLASCSPLQRLQRTHCLVCGCMLRHRDRHSDRNAFTEEMDVLLREVEANMEPQWWLLPDLSSGNDPITLEETVRLITQFAHYHILARLHLPYLLRSPSDHRLDHHKLTTINASREILTRYVALRSSRSTNNYCRGIDFLMFIAVVTLCIAHINSSHWRRQSDQGFHFNHLQHQRPADRGLMERALEAMQSYDRSGADEIDAQIMIVLQHLLHLEGKSAGESTFTMSCTGDAVFDCGGDVDGEEGTLTITIPHVGGVKIKKDHVSSFRSSESFLGGADEHIVSTMGATAETGHVNDRANQLSRQTREIIIDGGRTPALSDPEFGAQDWSLQGVDTALFDDLVRDWDMNIPGL